MADNPTPTRNRQLATRVADFTTIWEALDYAARGETGINFYSARGELTHVLPYAVLREKAVHLAKGLAGLKLPRETRVLMLADTDPDFIALFFACQYVGFLAVPVALPAGMGGRDAYVEQLRTQIRLSGARLIMGAEGFLPLLQEAAADSDVYLVGNAQAFYDLPHSSNITLMPFQANERGYLQYSSGSTRFPHGVDIRQSNVTANCHGIARHGLTAKVEDRAVSWLPLYHDMGLVGFMLTPMMVQVSIDYLPTRDFARRPLMWLQLISRNRGTLSYSPSFGYDLVSRRAGDDVLAQLDLRSWRAAGIGGDMIQTPVLRRFIEVFGPCGFDARAFVPSYGMAETVLAVSFAPLNQGLQTDRVDRAYLAAQQAALPASSGDPATAREFALCGEVLPDHSVEIRDEQGKKLSERQVGRIFVKGPSVMPGYYQDDAATRAVLSPDGWLDTGDLGYWIGQSLVVTGRAKDLIIVNGRNIWPQDLEWAVETLPQLRKGDAAAIAVETATGESVMMLIENRLSGADEKALLIRDIQAVVQRTAGVEAQVMLLPPRSLPHTSSGKLSRSRAKQMYLAGEFSAAQPEDVTI